MQTPLPTTAAPLLHRLLHAHPLLVFDADALVDYPSVNPQDTWALACEALADDADHLPRLLDLSDLSAADADKVLAELDQSENLTAPPLLLGDITPGADLGRWALTQVTQAPDTSKHWLRWHDVRVWANLLWIATPEQLAYLVGPARSVGWSWQGMWLQTEFPTGEKQMGPTKWSPAQWQQIQSIGVINRVFARQGQPSVNDLPGRARQLAEADAQAHSMTIWDMASRVDFAEHTARYGQEFWQAAQFHPLMTRVATREATYAEVAGAQTEEFWAELDNRVGRAKA
ncbi:hypothetical protein [Aquabacterium sp.]|uniref:hypothetical protein n=1 Tax=Aquabacterium sp. TaxID=1872578 RepID=UPI00248A124E|nr:hypothetical protein [Aquabacterium sp.]MDI1258281.1 hypothetical protein [Aquabacterium sp.]